MDVSEILKCPVCRGIFNNPKQLPCQHSLCNKPCLEGILKRAHSGHFRCPVCKTEHVLPDGGVDIIPKSHILQQLLDVFEKHSATLSSCRQTADYLASDEIIGLDERPSNIILSSEEASDIGLPYVCQVCKQMVRQCKICLHCENTICEQCHEKHMNLVRSAILTYHDHIQMAMTRIEEKQTASRYILSKNKKVASDGDTKRLFQTFEQRKHDMSPYFESVQSVIDETVDENKLIAIMFQGEEHLIDLSNLEINPLMSSLETQFERHSNPSTNVEHRQPSIDQSRNNNSRNIQVGCNVSGGFVPAEHLRVNLPNPRTNERRSGQRGNNLTTNAGNNLQGKQRVNSDQFRNNDQSLTKGSYLRCIVCFVAVIITGIRFGIGIWTTIEGGDIAMIKGSILIGKSFLDLILIFWVSTKTLEAVIMPNWKSALCSLAVLLNVLLSILVAVSTFTLDIDVNTFELTWRIVVGIDCVWSVLILITMLIILHRYF